MKNGIWVKLSLDCVIIIFGALSLKIWAAPRMMSIEIIQVPAVSRHEMNQSLPAPELLPDCELELNELF